MAVITFKGAAAFNSPGSAIFRANLSFAQDEMIVAVVAFAGTTPPNRTLIDTKGIYFNRALLKLDTVNGFGLIIYVLRCVWDAQTDITIRTEWDSSFPAYRTLSVYSVDDQYALDLNVSTLNATTGDPTSGSTTEHKDRDSIAFGVLCAQGPETDVSLTPSAGWTLGNKRGNTNVTAEENVTTTTLYQTLSYCDPISAAGTGATVRNWISACLVFRPIVDFAVDVYGAALYPGYFVNKADGSDYTWREVLSIARNRNVIQVAGLDDLMPAIDMRLVKSG